MIETDSEEMDLDAAFEVKRVDSGEYSMNLLRCDETFDLDQEIIQEKLNAVEVKVSGETWTPLYDEYIIDLQSKEMQYHPIYYDLSQCSNEISVLMRAILIDWLQKYCYDSGHKRESFHASISSIDRLLCKDSAINKSNLQMYGIVALYLSVKITVFYIQECPQSSSFNLDEEFNLTEIKSLELSMLKKLEWKVIPPTRYNLLACIMKEWDHFLCKQFSCVLNNNPQAFELMDECSKSIHVEAYNTRMITFMEFNINSY